MADSNLENAIRSIRSLTDDAFAEGWREPLTAVESMKNGARLLRKIAKASDKNSLEDDLAEAFFAVILAGLDFDVEFYPMPGNRRGPDLRITRGAAMFFVEVARIRKKTPDPIERRCLEETGHFQKMFNPAAHIKKVYDQTLSKLSQAGYRDCIVAVWNDWDDLTRNHAETAALIIRSEMEKEISRRPEGGAFILWASRFRNAESGQQLFCHDLCASASLIRELTAANVDDLVRHAKGRIKRNRAEP